MTYFVIETIYKPAAVISRVNRNCYSFTSQLVVVTSNIVDVHWQKPGVNRHIQRNVFETQLIHK